MVSDCGYRRISESVQVGPQSVTKKPFVLNRSAGGRAMGIKSSMRSPLRQRMLHDMQIRNLADNTQQSYLLQVSSFARHFRRSPEVLGPEEIRAWLIHLREERKLAPSSLSPAVGALRFLYRVTLRRPWSDEDFPLPKKPVRLPVVLSLEEISTFFESVASLKQRTILMVGLAHGADTPQYQRHNRVLQIYQQHSEVGQYQTHL